MNTKAIRVNFNKWFDGEQTEGRGFHSEFHCGANAGYMQAVKDMEESHVFYWEPDEETDLGEAVISELISFGTFDEIAWEFSWNNEDNESFPAIAEYVGEKYNQYRFIIDLRPFLPSNLESDHE